MGKINTSYKFDRGSIPKLYNELKKLNTKKTDNPVKVLRRNATG